MILKPLAALSLFMLFPIHGIAQIYNYTYTNTHGVVTNSNPSVTWMNPSSTIAVNLISGLDRKERLIVTRDSDGVEVFQGTTDIVTVNDRITAADGSEYYGKAMVLPALGNGSFTIKNETLDNKGILVATTTNKFSIDVTPPVIPGPITWIRAGWVNGSVEIFSNWGATQALTVTDLSDSGSGLSKAEWFAIDAAGIRRSVAADLNTDTLIALAPAAIAAGTNVAPQDQAFYTFGFRIYDKAGNYSEISRRSAIDRTVPSYIQHQVQNAQTGVWEDYVPGMKIYANPLQFRYKFRRQDHANYNGTEFGWYGMNSNVDANFVYYNVTLSYPESYRYSDLATKAGLFTSFMYKNLKFTPASGVLLAPQYVSGDMHLKNANSWTGSDTVRMTSPDCIDVAKINVEPRGYVQKATITGLGECNIAAGQSSCSIPLNYCKTSGRGYVPSQTLITGTGAQANLGGLSSHLYLYWDFNPTTINSLTLNSTEKSVRMQTTDQDTTNDWTKYMWVTDIFSLKLTDVAGKESLLKPAKTEVINYQQKIMTFDYSSLPSGRYTAVASATDSYGNIATTALAGGILHDTQAPEVSVMFKGQPADGQLVRGLENLDITLKDDLTKPSVVSITLDGGPTSDKVSVGWYETGNNKIVLQYPRVFPSSDNTDAYNLTINAVDEGGNKTTKVSRFRYVPDNLIEFNTLKTLAVNASLKTSDNKPLAYIQSNSIRKKDGSLLTGNQNANLTVRRDAKFGVNLNGVSVNPGETKDVVINFGTGEGILIPVFPNQSGVSGGADFMVELPQIK
ncbi:DUF4165 domain-containing protein [Escherichia coli]|nr:DUF4165 domain-containing protein [Escherichia coli]